MSKLSRIQRQVRFNRKLKGVFSAFVSGITYLVRNILGDWSPFFGNYVGQRYGRYDTFTCWDFAGCEILETQCEYLMKTGQFTPEDIKWFRDNNCLDSDDDFYFSRRYAAIISGVKDNGNDQDYFWDIVSKNGIIPFSALPYSVEEAQSFLTQNDFNNEYFNEKAITPAMYALGKEFLNHVNIQHEEVGKRWTKRDPKQIMAELKQSPLQIGIPVPQDGTWNQEFIRYNGRSIVDHSVELYKYEEGSDFPYYIYDSYEPHLKRLSAGYYIPIITKAVITAKTPKPVVIEQKNSILVLIWTAVQAWFDSLYSLKKVKVA